MNLESPIAKVLGAAILFRDAQRLGCIGRATGTSHVAQLMAPVLSHGGRVDDQLRLRERRWGHSNIVAYRQVRSVPGGGARAPITP